MQIALAAEITASRMYQAPIQCEWLTNNKPASHAAQRKPVIQTTTAKQQAAFEAFQEEVLRRCEAYA